MTREGATLQQMLTAAQTLGLDASAKQVSNVRSKMRFRERLLRKKRAERLVGDVMSTPHPATGLENVAPSTTDVDPEHVKLVLRHGLMYFGKVIDAAERRVETLV